MLDNLLQFGYEGLEVKGITIHNSGSEESANDIFKDMNNNLTDNHICHFLVDETGPLQIMPLDWCVYQVTKSKNWANSYTIGVEICRSQSLEDLYNPSHENAIKLIKELMSKYSLTTDDIYFHKDFSRQHYCPHRILETYQNKSNFINDIFGLRRKKYGPIRNGR